MSNTYVVPQVKVFQEFSSTPAALYQPLRAFVFGPNYFVQSGETAAYLGQYDKTPASGGQAFLWPDRPAGGIVDEEFTTVTIKNALLKYYENVTGGTAVYPVDNYTNRLYVASVNLKDNGTTYPLADAFYGRDVAVGDVARVYVSDGDELVEKWTKVVDIIPDYTTPAAGDDVADSANATTATENAVCTTVTGSGFTVTGLDESDMSGYDGATSGRMTETYTITVTAASSSGVGGLAKVVSASGTDNDYDVPLVEDGQTIGSRGLTFDWAGSGDWAVGDTFTIEYTQAYTAPTITVTDTDFDSESDLTYVVRVTRGGATDGTARITVTAADGSDASGPHEVTDETDITIGTKGLVISIDADSLVFGDRWYIACTGQTATTYRTLVLADSLPSYMLDTDSASEGNQEISDVNLQLFAVIPELALPRFRASDMSEYNWDQSETEIILKGDADVYHEDFADDDGYVALELHNDPGGLYSKAYVNYRALLPTYSSDINTISDISTLEDILGTVDANNPLALGVYYALSNSNGTDVKFMAVPTNDSDGYSAVLDKATGRRDVYTFVPMTTDATIQALVAAHVDAMSTELRNQWRIAFFNGESSSAVSLIGVGENYPDADLGTYATEDLVATVTDDPYTTGDQYTKVLWEAAPDGAGFVDAGVRAGDQFITNYNLGDDGVITSETYIIDSVISNQELRLYTGPTVPNSEPIKFAINRVLTKNEEAAAYGIKAGAFATRRVYYVWPDYISDASGEWISGIYACAAIAGLISGVVPQQGLTNVAISGFSAVPRTTEYFSESQLNTMAGSGVWIIAQDPDNGEIYSRHEISTCTTDLNCRELMVTKNVDHISFTFYDQLKPLIGRANVTTRFLEQLRRQILGTKDYLIASGTTPSLGGQLINAEILELRQHAINLDQVVVVLQLTIPYPVNVIELKLVV